MKKFAMVILAAASLSGCAQWETMSESEKTAIIVGGAILVGASIIKNSSGDTVINQNCVKDHAGAVCPWE